MKIIEYIHLLFDFIVDFIFGLFQTSEKVIAPHRPELVLMGAIELAEGIRSKQFKSEQVIQAHIDRIEEVNGLVNAMVDSRFNEALAEARAIDERIDKYTEEDFKRKPFLGVPFTSKESTLCEDMSCTFGLIERKGMKADQDAVVVANMKQAGGILLGVTNVPQLNLWVETHNPIYGITRNPYDSSRNVGGSSGGEAALIAACGSPFGVGTDIGGSIRIPAYMCGIFGHKCSSGLTDTKGLTFRDGSEIDRTMVSTGPLVRKAADIIPGIEVLLGEKARILKLHDPVNTKQLKYYFIESNQDLKCSPMHGDVEYALKMVVDHLKIDRTVEQLEIPELKYSYSLFKYWMNEEGADFPFDVTNHTYRAAAKTELWNFITRQSNFSFSVIMNLINTQWLPDVDADWAKEVTEQIRQYLLDKLAANGVLIYPTWPQTAGVHHAGYLRPYNFSYTSIFNTLKLPVTQVPLGLTKAGLPVGIQVVAAPYNDRLCIAVAKDLEKVFGGYVPPFENKMKSS